MIAALFLVGCWTMVLVYALWLYYLAVMCLKRANDHVALSGASRIAALSVLWPAYLLDFLTNMTVMTILFLEVPREWLVTERVSRHAKESTWRGRFARWVCRTLLDRFDPSGCHCK